MELPTICICTAAARTNLNLVWNAMGRGPDTFIRRLASTPVSEEDTPTHYLMQDMSAYDYDVVRWQALTAGDMPGLDDNGNPIMWGEESVISQEDAIAASTGGNLHIYTAAGPMTPTERDAWRDGILAGRELAFIPDPL